MMARKLVTSLAMGAALVALGLAAPVSASAAPEFEVSPAHYPERGIAPGGYISYLVTVANSGDAPTNSPIDVELSVPAGLTVVGVDSEEPSELSGTVWACSVTTGGGSATCSGPGVGGSPPLGPGEEACVASYGKSCRILITAHADPGLSVESVVTPIVEACGGGAVACANATEPTEVVSSDRDRLFSITDFDGGVFDLSGDIVTQAGARPQTAFTAFVVNQFVAVDGAAYSSEDFKDVIIDLPAGLIGNPNAISTCSEFELTGGEPGIPSRPTCPVGSQIGYLKIGKNGSFGIVQGGVPGSPTVLYAALFNMKTPRGKAALLGFNVDGAVFHLGAELLRDDSVPGGYRVRVASLNAPQNLAFEGAGAVVWGIPADTENDSDRGLKTINSGGGESCANPDHGADCSLASPDAADPAPFFTLPTSCAGPVATELTLTSWQGGRASSSFLSHDDLGPVGNDGCEALPFAPSLKARPTTSAADSPTGLDVDLRIPQNDECDPGPPVSCEPATAHLKDTTVTLPEGLVINPSGANGLDGCSESEVDVESTEPAECPDASRVGSVEVETPLLDHPLPGSVYVADPYENPFDSLLALYLVVNDPESGTVVKIPGEAELDSKTGRITSTFEENPQVPFEDFHLEFFGGAGAPLVTPPTCGTHRTRSQLSSWAGQNVDYTDSWSISRGPSSRCARSENSVPHLPSFEAGTVRPIAGIHTPFVLNLRRPDGSQRFGSLTVSPPPGLTATLAATPPCPEALLAAAARRDGKAEQRDPSCPLASRVGTVHAQAGAGPAPYNAPGTAYLAGPYKGAPLSLAIVTPAVAGPFDLGVVVIRTALHVNPTTAQITAVSDPIPSMLEGIPLNVRSASVRLDKPGFALNPTSCDPMLFGGTLTSTEGAVAQLIERFQLAECGRLGFKPRVNLRLFGGIKRAKYQGVRAVVRPRPGDANISRTVVRFPRSAFVAQEHIRTICTRVQWAADACPKGSIYGKAIAQSPLLSYPLQGNVYLRSSDNELPDAVAGLRGPAWQPLRVEVAIRNDSVKGALRNTVQVVPDAPVSYFRLQLFGGKKGLIVNSRNICAGSNKATVVLGAHSGARTVLKPRALNPKCKKAKRKAKAKKRRKRAARRAAVRR